jgi:hypothetical protein
VDEPFEDFVEGGIVVQLVLWTKGMGDEEVLKMKPIQV